MNGTVYSKRYPPKFVTITKDLGVVVQNTWYTCIEVSNAEFLMAAVQVAVANETVEMRATIDGTICTCTAGIALTAGGANWTSLGNTLRCTVFTPSPILTAASVNLDTLYSVDPTWLKGRMIKIEARKTTAAGAATLTFFGVYGKY